MRELTHYRIRKGDRVVIRDGWASGKSSRTIDGELIAFWDFDRGREGIAVKVWKQSDGHHVPWIDVIPDEEAGFGVHTFNALFVQKASVRQQEAA